MEVGSWANVFSVVGFDVRCRTLVLVYPMVLAGRRLLDARPTPERAMFMTAVMHAVLMALFGVAIIKAIQTAGSWRGIAIPVPHAIATLLLYITGGTALLTVLNLALRGLGAPFAVALSRRLATDWLYSRTRNPMVLATLAGLLAVGLWLQSALFLIWVIVLVTPALIFFVKVYEERELEIRFGTSYKEYRERTSFLWPRKQRGKAA